MNILVSSIFGLVGLAVIVGLGFVFYRLWKKFKSVPYEKSLGTVKVSVGELVALLETLEQNPESDEDGHLTVAIINAFLESNRKFDQFLQSLYWHWYGFDVRRLFDNVDDQNWIVLLDLLDEELIVGDEFNALLSQETAALTLGTPHMFMDDPEGQEFYKECLEEVPDYAEAMNNLIVRIEKHGF